MGILSYEIIKWVAWSIGTMLLILSLFFCYRRDSPKYLRSFPIYCFVSVISDLIVSFHRPAQSVTYFLFTIFELCYFSFLLSKLIQTRGIIFILWGLIVLFLMFLVYFVWRYQVIPFGMPEEGEGVILLLPCLVCYKETLTAFSTPGLIREPSFWMVTGILFYIILLFPTLFTSQYYN